MNANKKLLSRLIILFGIYLVIGLWAIDKESFFIFFLLLVITVLLYSLFLQKRWEILLAIFMIVVISVYWLFADNNPGGFPPTCIKEYHVEIAPSNLTEGAFYLTEEFSTLPYPNPLSEKPSKREQERTISSVKKGLLLRELVIDPGYFCDEKMINVKLNDMPKGSFYTVKGEINLIVDEYLDNENITWATETGEVRFAYLPPPYHYFKTLLLPFINITSFSQTIAAFIGVVVGLVLSQIKSSALDAIKNKLSNAFPKKKTKAIVKKKSKK
jgi:hypothetical protein